MPPPDGHLIKDAGIAFFPESGKLYRVPPLAVDALCAWLAGTGPLPPEGAAMAPRRVRKRGRARRGFPTLRLTGTMCGIWARPDPGPSAAIPSPRLI